MRLLYTFIKDMKVSFKTFYIYIEIFMALIVAAVLLFVIPENFSSNLKIYAYIDNSISSNITDTLIEHSKDEVILVNSINEIKLNLKDDKNSVGMSISKEDEKIVYDLILQGYEGTKYRNLMEKSLLSSMAENLPNYKKITNVVNMEGATEKLSDRLNMLPVYLVLNSSFMGLFIIATYIFMDKDEGTIKALAVTPAKVWEYLLSKMGVMLFTGLVTGLLLTFLVAGTKVNYPHLILLLISTNIFGTALGLYISSFYDSITSAMGALYITIITFAFATVSYYMPSFSPLIIKLLPSYPMLFAFREAFLKEPNLNQIYLNVVIFSILGIIVFILANRRFKKTLTV